MDYGQRDQLLLEEVRKLRDGESKDFDRLYELSGRYLYKIILDVVQDPHAAEDLLQETYLQIYQKIHTLQEPEAFHVWAGRIATNLCLRHIRRNRHEIPFPMEHDESGDLNSIFDTAAEDNEAFLPENVLVDREQRRRIARILDNLPVEQKLTVQFYYYEEMSVREIAKIMDCPEGTVKSRLNYARQAIRAAVVRTDEEHRTGLYGVALCPVLRLVFREGAESLNWAGRAGAGKTGGNGMGADNAGTGKAGLGSTVAGKVAIAVAVAMVAAAVGIGAYRMLTLTGQDQERHSAPDDPAAITEPDSSPDESAAEQNLAQGAAPEDHVMIWNDDNLELAMREITGIADGDIMFSDVEPLTDLDLMHREIHNIDALAELENLAFLNIGENYIQDIGPLSGLTNLVWLNADYNDIEDITPLSGLTGLTFLRLEGNDVRDVTPLSGLTELTDLYIDMNDITDISALSDLTKLTCLSLHGNKISDFTVLEGMPELTRLSLSKSAVLDASTMDHLKQNKTEIKYF